MKIIYNLYKHSSNIYLPDAYWASTFMNDELSFIKQKVININFENIENLAVHQQLHLIIQKLTPSSLEKRFISDKKQIKDFNALIENKVTKKSVLAYIDKKVNEFLQLVVDNNFYLCLDVKRNSTVKSHILVKSDSELKPLLCFEKNAEGVIYKMQLQDKGENWEIHTKKVLPVCNNPAWIVANNTLNKISGINANMVKPFIAKDKVFISDRMVNTYFEKFIIPVVKKVDIEAIGFQSIIIDQLPECRIGVYENFMKNKWEINLKMIYEGAEFFWNDKKENKVLVNFIEDNIQITKIVRNKQAENIFFEKIKEFGLYFNQENSFSVSLDNKNSSDSFTNIEWLIENKSVLEINGFEIFNPTFGNSLILLDNPILEINSTRKNDFFDVYAILKFQNLSIPFSSLRNNILLDDPYFMLPDGQIFLIPQEWMSKYSEFFQFAKVNNDAIRFEKSKFTVLENIEIKTDIDNFDVIDEHNFKLPLSFKAKLRPYQLDGVLWLAKLYHNGLGACLADDMGLGKTLQTLAILLYAKEQKLKESAIPAKTMVQLDLFSYSDPAQFVFFNSLIVMPASLIVNWQAEIIKFTSGLKVYCFVGSQREKNQDYLSKYDLILTTYQTVLKDIDILKEMNFDYIVLDESQQLKNRKSKIFNALIRLNAKHKISLSGTPIENSLSDLWAQMQFINHDLLGSFKFFENEFLKPIEKFSDENKISQLKTLVQAFLLRRTKSEVEKSLPQLLIKTHYSQMTNEQAKIYEKEKSAARNYLLKIIDKNDSKYKLQIFAVLTKLRQFANHPVLVNADYGFESGKFNDIIEQWDTIHKAGHKVLIFSSYVKHLDLLKIEFDKRKINYSYLTGNQNLKQRKQQIENFEQDEKVNSFLISLKAGGVGLNLTKADYVFILDPWWNPSSEEQAIARAHRIGQDKKVIAIKFITSKTIEEKILDLQTRKIKLADDILSNNEKINFTKEDINYLLE